ncbi:cytochrome c biogenesis heme-transporting ATPase CcmA [Polaromonas sp.]|uniref:cytochrome c biogenesis heme-transporting ATPase CcmA n=1 Tax=Polaromonas sp. TaxID=1869339 RepID=UPI0018430589|nr:cytochrome c biogenesis heme-transporting ATPase CcmA [Polaromonas sp.]NMM05031.1 cytochrome c biogenesis heme-transporting ATPase CcmA [Polaromonas sp.]
MTLQAFELICTRGDRQLFNNVNFEIHPGEALRVAGTNGSGKTSLLRMLCGLASPAAGEVRWSGRNIRSVREEFASQLLYMGHANGVKDDLTAWENVVVAATLSGNSVTRTDAYQALDQLGLGKAADLPTRALSQGQRKRVALARLPLGMATPLWILDEPFTALDQKAVTELCGTLNHHLAHGGMVIYTTHQEIELTAQRTQLLDLNLASAC